MHDLPLPLDPHPPSRRPARRRRTRMAALAGAVLLCVAVSAGCAKPETSADVATLDAPTGEQAAGTTLPAAPTDPEDALRAFAKCMREHGVDMPDPQVGENGGVVMQVGSAEGKPMDRGVMDEAQKACEPLMKDVKANGPGKLDPEQEAKMKEEALAFAKCMREHGVDMPDPTFEEGGGMTMAIGSDDPDSATAQEAQDACQSIMTGPDGKPLPKGGPGLIGGGPAVRSSDDGGADGGATTGGGKP